MGGQHFLLTTELPCLFSFFYLDFREATGGKFSSRVTCVRRGKTFVFKSGEMSAATKASFFPFYVNIQDVIA